MQDRFEIKKGHSEKPPETPEFDALSKLAEDAEHILIDETIPPNDHTYFPKAVEKIPEPATQPSS